MKLIDLYLKARSKSAMTLALKTAGFIQDPESGALYYPSTSLNVIGTIYAPTGETTIVNGEPVPVEAPLSGYHANVRTQSAELAKALDTYRIYPNTPTQKWA